MCSVHHMQLTRSVTLIHVYTYVNMVIFNDGRSWDGDDGAIPLIHSTSFLSDRPPAHVLCSDYYGLARLGLFLAGINPGEN